MSNSGNSGNSGNIHFKYDISDLFKEEKEEKYEELKIRIEENIKMLKDQIYNLMDLCFKNKSQIEIVYDYKKKLDDLSTDIENFKKITNERIEKIFKLVIITNEKLDNQKR